MHEAELAVENSPPAWSGSLLGASVHGYLGAESPTGEHGIFFLLVSCQAASVKHKMGYGET